MNAAPDDRLAPPWPHPLLAGLRLGRAGLVAVAAFTLLGPAHGAWLLATRGRPSPFTCLFHRLVVAAMGITVTVRGGRPRDNALLVANHLGWFDILALGAVVPATFVAKSDVRQWPVLGWMARLQPTVFIERGRRGTIAAQVAALRKALNGGHVAMFPEGTTGDGSAVLPFRPALFAAAEGFAVQPVAIAYRERKAGAWGACGLQAWVWDGDKPFGTHFVRAIACGGAHCTIEFLPRPEAVARKQLAETCRDAIAASLCL